MTIHNGRIEAAPGKSGGGRIRAKLFNQRLGLKEILIDQADRREVLARSDNVAPEVGEMVTILLPTGTEMSGVVSWVSEPAFSVNLDPEARSAKAK